MLMASLRRGVRRAPMIVLLMGMLGARANAQIDPRTALLEQAGWQGLEAGRPAQALAAFREAEKSDPNNARVQLGAAVALFALRQDADSRRAVDRALALDPSLTKARELSGRLLYRAGDLHGAIRVFSGLEESGAADAAIRADLDRWRREAELSDRMLLDVGSGFTVSFEGPEDSALAAQVLDSLDRALTRVGAVLGVVPLAPIPVMLYTDQQFRDITKAPMWAAGAYDGVIRLPVRGALADAAELDRVVAHELTHALVRTLTSRAVPSWLNEGLATALERDGGPPELANVDPMPLASIRRFDGLTGAAAARAYTTSALAVQRLLDDAGGVAVANLLRDLGEGVDFETAFTRRMGRSFADFDASPPR